MHVTMILLLCMNDIIVMKNDDKRIELEFRTAVRSQQTFVERIE